jgi:hypothetical protein
MAYIGLSAANSASLFSVTGAIGAGVALFKESNEAVARSVFNDTNQTVYICYSKTASTGAFGFTTKVTGQSLYEFPYPLYYGPVSVVWQTLPTTGSLMATETFTIVKYP